MDVRTSLIFIKNITTMNALTEFLKKNTAGINEVLQTENTECGLACLAMVLSHHGHITDLASLRSKFAISQRGCTIKNIIDMASQLGMAARAVKADLNGIAHLRLPCILHWNFNHFVVLESVKKNYVSVVDPAVGRRKLGIAEISASFTGVALELSKTTEFVERRDARSISISQLFGQLIDARKSITQLIILAIVLEVFSIVNPIYVQSVLDKVIVSNDLDLLHVLAIGFILILIIHRCLEWMRAWMLMYLSTIVSVQWRSNVLNHLLNLPVGYFEKRSLGDIVSRYSSVDVIQRTLTVSFLESVLDGAMVIVTLTIMLIYSPSLSMVSLGAMSIYAFGRAITYGALKRATEEKVINDAKTQTNFLETTRGVKAIKLFSRQEIRLSAYINLLIDQLNSGVKVDKIKLSYSSVNSIVFGVERILVFYFGAQLVLDGIFTVGALLAFNIYREKFDSRVSSLIDKFYEFKMLRVHSERLADIVLESKEESSSNFTLNNNLSPSVELNNVSFQHSTCDPLILNQVSIFINAGESVALTGPSGSGKTTIVNIILGVLKPTAGNVLIGGMDISELGIKNVRDIVGSVMQDDNLFSGSIADNICFFDSEKKLEKVSDCARIAQIHDDIKLMPMGYDTLIGDMGVALSGGQKQRLLIARALYKEPKILLMDEATSHLDVVLEKKVNESIKSLKITRLIVAHRPETIQSADRTLDLSLLQSDRATEKDINKPVAFLPQPT